MRTFELCIRAENFLIEKGGKVKKTGFYAARNIEANYMSEATDKAMDGIRKDLRPLSLNEQGDPPSFKVIEVCEVYYPQEEMVLDSPSMRLPMEGYVWDEEEEEVVKGKTPISSWSGGWGSFRASLKEKDLHLHTMLIHFTNALFPVAALFMFLTIIFGSESFNKTYFYLMIIATVGSPLSYFAGILEWKRRHQGAMVAIFIAKIRYGVLIMIFGLVCTVWRALSPAILTDFSVFTVLFIILNLAILPPLVYLGHLGGLIVYEGVDE